MNEPQTRREWREAVNLAYGALAVEHARILGFIEGGPTVHIARCIEILASAAERGYAPNRPEGIRAILAEGDFHEDDHERIYRVVRDSAEMVGDNLPGVVAFLGAQ